MPCRCASIILHTPSRVIRLLVLVAMSPIARHLPVSTRSCVRATNGREMWLQFISRAMHLSLVVRGKPRTASLPRIPNFPKENKPPRCRRSLFAVAKTEPEALSFRVSDHANTPPAEPLFSKNQHSACIIIPIKFQHISWYLTYLYGGGSPLSPTQHLVRDEHTIPSHPQNEVMIGRSKRKKKLDTPCAPIGN